MPGLLGYFRLGDPDPEEVARQLDRMVAAVTPRHPLRKTRSVDGRCGLFLFTFGNGEPGERREPSAEELRLFFDGYLLNRGELQAHLSGAATEVRPDWTDGDLARAVFRLDGEAVVDRLHGSFNLAAYDPAAVRLQLLNCRHGARHLYCRSTPEYFAFASEAKALVGLPGPALEVDRLALLDLFNFGYLGGTRTLFRGIELLPHASVVTVTPGKVVRRRYWDYRYRNTGIRYDADDLVAEGAGLLRQAVRRYLDRFSRPGVPLSGGLDSRTILGFAAEERPGLPVFHCAWYAGEERLAHELCRRAGGDWHRYDPLEFNLEEATREGMELSDGNVHCHQFWFLPVVRQVQRERLADLLFDGYLMDVFLGDTFLVLPRRERYSAGEQRAVINAVWRRGSPSFVRRAFLPEFAREYEEANRASIDEGLAGIDEPHLSNRVQRFSLTNRSNRYSVALPNVHRQYVEYGYPGLDYDLTDFYLRLPPEIKAGARFYRQVICRALPQSAAVPWVKTGKPLDADKGWLTSRLGRLPIHQLGAMLLLRATRGRLDLSHRGDLNRHFRRDPAYRGFLTGLLRDPRTLSRGIIDRSGVERLIGFVDRGWPVLSLVQSLVTVELWHRRFVDG